MTEESVQSIHCTVCDQNKPLDEFYPSGRGSETGQCKGCIKKRQRPRPRKRKLPLTVNPEKLMEALSGGEADPRLELAAKVLAMQQRTIELLVARRK